MMIELFSKDKFVEVKRKYRGKIVVIFPYGERKEKVLKDKMKVVRFKRKNNYNFLNQPKFIQYDYFILISLTDIEDRINEIIKKIGDLLGDDKI